MVMGDADGSSLLADSQSKDKLFDFICEWWPPNAEAAFIK